MSAIKKVPIIKHTQFQSKEPIYQVANGLYLFNPKNTKILDILDEMNKRPEKRTREEDQIVFESIKE